MKVRPLLISALLALLVQTSASAQYNKDTNECRDVQDTTWATPDNSDG